MKNEKGFTLIELLVVIAIIGILAAIAIPQFAEYKTRAFDSRAQTDVRNGLTAEEAYFVDNEQYVACSDATCVGTGASALPGFVISDGVQIQFTVNSDSSKFAGASCHTRGSKDYQWTADTNVLDSVPNASCAGAPTPPAVS